MHVFLSTDGTDMSVDATRKTAGTWYCDHKDDVGYCSCSVIGLSFDFVLLNFLGFVSYAAYTCTLYADVDVQETYRDRHHGQGNGVRCDEPHIEGAGASGCWLL
jgi:PQ loop repeat